MHKMAKRNSALKRQFKIMIDVDIDVQCFRKVHKRKSIQ